MPAAIAVVLLLFSSLCLAEARVTTPVYDTPKVVYDFYLDDPAKMGAALFWIRSLINPLSEEPYGFAPEMMDIKVVIHGAEIVTVAQKNYERYRDVVERMRYYAALGVQFKVCALAAADFHYTPKDFYDFVEIVPSAFTELVHWQQQGYALITPQVMTRHYTVEEIR